MNRTTTTSALVVLMIAALLWWHWPAAAAPSIVHVAAAGDMACSSSDPRFADGVGSEGWCTQRAVSDLVADRDLDALFGLGDYQYEDARADDYHDVYGPSWGRLRAVTRPALGNQEYKVHDANTFTGYFGSRAPHADSGWYSYDLGQWHVVVLNSNCAFAGGCGDDSPQVQWLTADLAGDHHACTIAYWHHPRWSTGLYGGDQRTDTLWRVLADGGADVVLAAHEHDYERFRPLDAEGRQAADGVTSFVVGTGGQAVYGPDDVAGGGDLSTGRRLQRAASAVRIDDQPGALLLTLANASFDWQFIAIDGTTKDQGTTPCTH